jgi:hypothetical protein
MAKEREDDGIDQDGTEHEDENPEIVKPEPFILIVFRYPAPSARTCVEVLAVHEGS